MDAVGIGLKLHEEFRKRLGDTIEVFIPCNAWWAFDYHLDWLCAVLLAPNYDLTDYRQENILRCVTGTQEDCDLIIAFEDTIVILEAKMFGSWNKKQLRSKLERLKRLPTLQKHVNLHFVLASPKKWERVTYQEWSKWGPPWAIRQSEPHWIPLSKPEGQRLMVSRCYERGRPNQKGTWWGIFSTE